MAKVAVLLSDAPPRRIPVPAPGLVDNIDLFVCSSCSLVLIQLVAGWLPGWLLGIPSYLLPIHLV